MRERNLSFGDSLRAQASHGAVVVLCRKRPVIIATATQAIAGERSAAHWYVRIHQSVGGTLQRLVAR